MRLLNTKTIQLEKFDNHQNRPKYAILSHRWIDDQEVRYQDMHQAHRKWLPGWKKILYCCEQACKEGFDYAWVDTCCINQESSSELSEAINSMYDWYDNASICYAYLQDVTPSLSNTSLEQMAARLTRSTWFSRAWTLQELIAPRNVVFYDSEFNRLGDKTEFATFLEAHTYIPSEVLTNPQTLANFPAAVKMSWASHREATRLEDIAYSLFGLFEVNMPLLYGEGSRAFLRLQEEIIRKSNDHSVFLWHSQSDVHQRMSILAPSPRHFEACHNIVRLEGRTIKPYAMTNVGLQIELPLFPYHLDTYVALLDCCSTMNGDRYAILLAKDDSTKGMWYRTRVKNLDVVTLSLPDVINHALWQKVHITRDRPSYRSAASADTSQPHSCYGIRINAPVFLDYSADGIRPYALMAYSDWKTTPGLKSRQDLDETALEQNSNNSVLLSPSSFQHVSLFYTQSTSAKRKLHSRRNSSEGLRVRDLIADLCGSRTDATTPGTFEMPEMTRGISGAVFFDQLTHGIRAIKVGFDFTFRPVVFVATHEAGNDPQMQSWLRQWRFKHIEEFENSLYVRQDLRHDSTKHFWSLQPDMLMTDDVLHDKGGSESDAPVEIHKGVYGFRSTNPLNIDHWTFQPYKNKNWHIALSLEKRIVNDVMVWELSIDRKDQTIEFNIEVDCAD